jgi:hypothetical protein
LEWGGFAMTRALAIMFVTMTLLASPAATRGVGRGSPMGFAPHPGFVHPGFFARPGFFPHLNFVNNRFFAGGFFVGPGVVVAPYPSYPYPYYPNYPPIHSMWRPPDRRAGMGDPARSPPDGRTRLEVADDRLSAMDSRKTPWIKDIF